MGVSWYKITPLYDINEQKDKRVRVSHTCTHGDRYKEDITAPAVLQTLFGFLIAVLRHFHGNEYSSTT